MSIDQNAIISGIQSAHPPSGQTRSARLRTILCFSRRIMINMEDSVNVFIYAILAAPSSCGLLFRPRSGLPLPSPKRALAFEQGALLFHGRPLSRRLTSPKPGLPEYSCSNLRLAPFVCRPGLGVVVSTQARRLEPDILLERRFSNSGGGRSLDDHRPWHRSDSPRP